jgi:ACT domain-containing protein
VTETQLQKVLQALSKSSISIVSIHHHMTGETPKLLLIHYWGHGSAQQLAKGIKSALNAQK